jgi:hypothetical protein
MNKLWRTLTAFSKCNTSEILNYIKQYKQQGTKSFITNNFTIQILLHVSTFLVIFSDTYLLHAAESFLKS